MRRYIAQMMSNKHQEFCLQILLYKKTFQKLKQLNILVFTTFSLSCIQRELPHFDLRDMLQLEQVHMSYDYNMLKQTSMHDVHYKEKTNQIRSFVIQLSMARP